MEYMWRVENKKGIGPYWSGDVEIDGQTLGQRHSWDGGAHPCWDEEEYEPELYKFQRDSWVRDYSKYSFGFHTIKQYCDWFSREERKALFKKGYRLKKVPVKNKIVGRKQCIGIKIK